MLPNSLIISVKNQMKTVTSRLQLNTPITRFKLDHQQSLLLDVLRAADDGLSLLWGELITRESIFQLAIKNEVESVLAHRLAELTGWEALPKHWLQAHGEIYKRISIYMDELNAIATILAAEDIPIVALKNSGIACGIYFCCGCCPMGDLDLLVEKRHFSQAHQILLSKGYQFEFRSPLEKADLSWAEVDGGTEYWKPLTNGERLWLELQWRPVAGRWIRSDQEPASEELIARSITIEGSAVRLLAPEDNLLQVALHTAKHTYVRAPGFRLHLDVDRIVRAYPDLDWLVFLDRVKLLQIKTAVYFSLAIPYELFGTPIPNSVLEALRPTGWKEALLRRWIQKAGLFNPHEKKFGRIKYILFTALLYDDFVGLVRGIFPDSNWMREHYHFHNRLFLPYYHLHRLGNLLFRRLAT